MSKIGKFVDSLSGSMSACAQNGGLCCSCAFAAVSVALLLLSLLRLLFISIWASESLPEEQDYAEVGGAQDWMRANAKSSTNLASSPRPWLSCKLLLIASSDCYLQASMVCEARRVRSPTAPDGRGRPHIQGPSPVVAATSTISKYK